MGSFNTDAWLTQSKVATLHALKISAKSMLALLPAILSMPWTLSNYMFKFLARSSLGLMAKTMQSFG
jgi:hypothetical protein